MPIKDVTREEARILAKRYPVARSALLPMLHLVQSDEGYVSEDGIAMCAEVLGLTKAEVGSVASFYTMYKREPFGDYLLSVCTNPTCRIAGGQAIYDAYVEACQGHVDLDGAGVMVEHAECLGSCDAAPVVQVNYEMYGPVTTEAALELLARAKAGDPPASNRSGEVPGTIREVHRGFSGIEDGVDEHLSEAARLQSLAAVPPAWRSGETDIPVTHPGGDPVGHGGQHHRNTARLEAAPPQASTEVPEEQREVLEEVAATVTGTEGELASQVTGADTRDETPAVKDQPASTGGATPPEAASEVRDTDASGPEDA